MSRRLGYIPTLKQMHFRADDGSYRGQHRPGLRLWWRRALIRALTPVKRLADYLATLRPAVRLTVPVRPPRLAPRPATLAIRVKAQSLIHGLAQASQAIGQLRQALMSGRSSAPDRDTARRPGAHRFEDLSHMANTQYVLCMQARVQYVEQTLARLAQFAHKRAFGESSWKEARRANRYAAA